MSEGIPYYEFKVDVNDVENGIKNFMKTIKPSWNTKNIVVREMSGGNVNKMLHCLSDGDCKDSVVVRVFNDDIAVDRDTEVMGLQIAHAAGCGAPITALFTNGMVIGFISGVNLTYNDYLDHKVMRNVQHALGRIHSIDINALNIVDAMGNQSRMDTTNRFHSDIEQFISGTPEKFRLSSNQEVFINTFKSKEKIKEERDFVFNCLQDIELPVCFTHLDLHCRNIMYDHDTGKVAFVDFEFCGYCYEAIDYSLHLSCRTIFMQADFWPMSAEVIPESDIRMWSQWYLEGKASTQNADKQTIITQYDVDRITEEINIMFIVNMFHRAMLLMFIADGALTDGEPVLRYAGSIYSKYLKRKEDLIDLIKAHNSKYRV